MLLQDKRGVSVIIEYVLLVVFAIVMGAIVYNWVSTYIPNNNAPPSCPDSVSLFLENANYCGSQLNLTIKNNGRFDVGGYLIHATNSSSQSLATIDLSSYLDINYGGLREGNTILFYNQNNNSLKTGTEEENVFTISSDLGNISSLEIVPITFQIQNNRNVISQCSDEKIVQTALSCTAACVPAVPGTQSAICGSMVCGSQSNGTCGSVNCGPNNGQCTGLNVCNGAGQCVAQGSCTDTCTSLKYQCGTQLVCGANTNCGTCTGGQVCNTTGQCTNLGNGVCDPGETCANEPACAGLKASCSGDQICVSGACSTIGNGVCDPGESCGQEPTACEGYQATCSSGNVCIAGQCESIAGNPCTNFCISLSHKSSTTGGCSNSCSAGGTHESGGDQYCPIGGSGFFGGSGGLCCCYGL